MLNFFLLLALAVCAGTVYWMTARKLNSRMQTLERDLQSFLDVMCKIAEVQKKSHQKFSTNYEDLEERIMELSVPSHDSNLPLERRHRVLALARQGLEVEDIVKRLKAPIGETELILNLRKYMGEDSSRTAKMNKQVSPYA